MGKVEHHSRQQMVREMLRENWKQLLSGVGPGLQTEQDRESAEVVIAEIWPALAPEHLLLLDSGDRAFLCRSKGEPPALRGELEKIMLVEASKLLTTISDTNQHARGAKLEKIIAEEIAANWDDVRREVDHIFESAQSDCLGDPAGVRKRVIALLAERCLAEISGNCDESAARHHLKVLAALVTPSGRPAEKQEQLTCLKDGTTASFPYIPKYLGPGSVPVIRLFEPSSGDVDLSCFTPQLVGLFPEAVHVRDCLQRFQSRDGVLMWLVDPEGPITGSLAADFQKLPDFVPREAGGLSMPKGCALELSRRDGLKMPDGVICAVSLAVLIESVLRQTVQTLHLGGGVNQRPAKIIPRLDDKVRLRPQTRELLETLFDPEALSPRDAMAHGAFFAGSERRVCDALAGMARCLDLLQDDLCHAGVDANVFKSSRWDSGVILPSDVLQLLDEQESPGPNLVDQMSNDHARGMCSRC